MALKALQALVRRNRARVYLDGPQKAELLEQYEFRCAICGGASSSFEWDHVARHSESFREPEFQPLCPQCHKDKTATESRSLDSDLLASSFDPRAWNQYVLSPRPPPLVYRVRALPESLSGFEIADVVRCRKRALELSAHELPMFCALDQIRERTEPELGDLCSLTARYKHFVHQLGYSDADQMHAQYAIGFSMGDDFDEPGGFTHSYCTADSGKRKATGFIRNVFGFELLFGFTHPCDFRLGIDYPGHSIQIDMARQSGDTFRNGNAFLKAFMGQHRAANTIAYRPNAVNTGMAVIVHFNLATRIDFYAGAFGQ